MPCNLYQSAAASLLEDERESLATFEDWLEDLSESSGRAFRGDQILDNLRSESHLLGDGTWGDASEMTEFLRCCVQGHAGVATDQERETGYKSSCLTFEGKGFPIERDHLPDKLLRYSRDEPTALDLIGRVLTDRVKQDVIDKKISLADAFARLGPSSWDSGLVDDLRLGGGAMVFATFEHPAGAPRDHAGNMAAALALPPRPRRRKEILVEFSYPTDSVSKYRFPTVADAGWVQEFKPAAEMEPSRDRPETCFGWTRPTGGWRPQPELVHGNESLRVLDGPPRFVGRY
ncbi:MAG TPA: hypothetical protein VF173_12965 [Thermoanaerobaculia bacterium]|nr:hypothetical protein [Thermoanaerobaculia bacterium]